MLYLLAALAALMVWAWWFLRRQSRDFAQAQAERASGVYAQRFLVVDDDGGVREPNFLECRALNTEYDPQDGARPFIKRAWDSRDGRGSPGGFLPRQLLPPGTPVQPREGDEAARERAFRGTVQAFRLMGATLTETADGDFIASNNPAGRFRFADGPDGQPGTELIRCPAHWRSPDAP